MPQPALEIGEAEFYDRMFCQQLTLGSYYAQLWLQESEMATAPLWECRFYWFKSYALCVATRYASQKEWERMGKPNQFRRQDGGSSYGHVSRFYLIGCQHPHLVIETKRMGWHECYCPDCGYRAEQDSSG